MIFLYFQILAWHMGEKQAMLLSPLGKWHKTYLFQINNSIENTMGTLLVRIYLYDLSYLDYFFLNFCPLESPRTSLRIHI